MAQDKPYAKIRDSNGTRMVTEEEFRQLTEGMTIYAGASPDGRVYRPGRLHPEIEQAAAAMEVRSR